MFSLSDKQDAKESVHRVERVCKKDTWVPTSFFDVSVSGVGPVSGAAVQRLIPVGGRVRASGYAGSPAIRAVPSVGDVLQLAC